MDIWLLLLLLGLIPLLINWEPKKNTEKCQLHEWDRLTQPDDDKLMYLQCKKCGYYPGRDDGAEL